MEAVEQELVASGGRLLQVKTLGSSRPSEHDAKTLRFYHGMGFLRLEESPTVWNGMPCLILVKPRVPSRRRG